MIEALVGTLATALITGVFAFSREQIKNAREDVVWYREKVLPILDRQMDTLEEIVEHDRIQNARWQEERRDVRG